MPRVYLLEARLRNLALIVAMLTMSVAYACGTDTVGAPIPTPPDAGRDGGLKPGDSSTSTDLDAATNKDAAPVRSVVAVGGSFACLLAKDRTVSCWGNNDVGQLGRDPQATPSCGAFKCSATPAKVEGLPDIVDVAAGDDFACALDSAGGVWCWGSNAKGQLSVTTTAPFNFTPQKIIVNVVSLDAAGSHVCVLENDTFVRCWGENTCDIFGSGADAGVQVAARQLKLPGMSQISVGPDAMCTVELQGGVLCWGADHRGSLGHDLDPAAPLCNGVPHDPVPKHVQAQTTEIPITNILDVHMGDGVACARRDDGQVLCWGDNERGALGQGFPDTLPHRRAVELPALKAAQLEVRGQTPCAIAAQRLLCWGDGRYGQLDSLAPDSGCGGQGCRPLGYAIPGMMPVREVFASPRSIATIKDDLSVWMWGRNDSAELALPQSDPANQPCAGGSICVPQPKALTNLPPLD